MTSSLLVSIHSMIYPITKEVLHQVFAPYGFVENIIPAGFQAIIQYQTPGSATSAFVALQGRNIYDGCCRLDIRFHRVPTVVKLVDSVSAEPDSIVPLAVGKDDGDDDSPDLQSVEDSGLIGESESFNQSFIELKADVRDQQVRISELQSEEEKAKHGTDHPALSLQVDSAQISVPIGESDDRGWEAPKGGMSEMDSSLEDDMIKSDKGSKMSEIDMVKERFARPSAKPPDGFTRLLLGEDMSESGKGSCTSLEQLSLGSNYPINLSSLDARTDILEKAAKEFDGTEELTRRGKRLCGHYECEGFDLCSGNMLISCPNSTQFPTQEEVARKCFSQDIFTEAVRDGDLEVQIRDNEREASEQDKSILVPNGICNLHSQFKKSTSSQDHKSDHNKVQDPKNVLDFEIVPLNETYSSGSSDSGKSTFDHDIEVKILAYRRKLPRMDMEQREKMIADVYKDYVSHGDKHLARWVGEEVEQLQLYDVGATVQKVTDSFEGDINGKEFQVKSIRNLIAHKISPYQIHAEKSVPMVKREEQTYGEECEFYAIEIFYVREDLGCRHYMKNFEVIASDFPSVVPNIVVEDARLARIEISSVCGLWGIVDLTRPPAKPPNVARNHVVTVCIEHYASMQAKFRVANDFRIDNSALSAAVSLLWENSDGIFKEHLMGTIPLGGKPSFIVCPLFVLSTWVTQREEYSVAGTLETHMHQGEYLIEVEVLQQYDTLLTTYRILIAGGQHNDSPGKCLKWWRIIFDEAHVIKNFISRISIAVTSLKAKQKFFSSISYLLSVEGLKMLAEAYKSLKDDGFEYTQENGAEKLVKSYEFRWGVERAALLPLLQKNGPWTKDFLVMVYGKWIKTYTGYQPPDKTLLLNLKWMVLFKYTEGHSGEQFYGSNVNSYTVELNAMSLLVDDKEKGLEVIASHIVKISNLSTFALVHSFFINRRNDTEMLNGAESDVKVTESRVSRVNSTLYIAADLIKIVEELLEVSSMDRLLIKARSDHVALSVTDNQNYHVVVQVFYREAVRMKSDFAYGYLNSGNGYKGAGGAASEAGEIAGLVIIGLVNDPTADAIVYRLTQKITCVREMRSTMLMFIWSSQPRPPEKDKMSLEYFGDVKDIVHFDGMRLSHTPIEEESSWENFNVVAARFPRLNLEDKVKFEGQGIDMNLGMTGPTNGSPKLSDIILMQVMSLMLLWVGVVSVAQWAWLGCCQPGISCESSYRVLYPEL